MSKRMLAPIAVALLGSGLVVGACNEGGKPPVGPVVISAPIAFGSGADGGVEAGRLAPPSTAFDAGDASMAAADDAGTGFYDCTMDSDCTAVPKVGCCINGYMEAVSTRSVEAYKASFICPTPNQVCPHVMVSDTRQPECNNGTHQCEMVEIKSIQCGGFIRNQHRCPEGLRCVFKHVPDIPGTCVK